MFIWLLRIAQSPQFRHINCSRDSVSPSAPKKAQQWILTSSWLEQHCHFFSWWQHFHWSLALKILAAWSTGNAWHRQSSKLWPRAVTPRSAWNSAKAPTVAKTSPFTCPTTAENVWLLRIALNSRLVAVQMEFAYLGIQSATIWGEMSKAVNVRLKLLFNWVDGLEMSFPACSALTNGSVFITSGPS